MPLKSKRSPAEGEFLFEIEERPTEECLTAFGGVPLFVRTARSLDVPGSVKRNLALKQRDRGLDEATYIESFFVLNAAGGAGKVLSRGLGLRRRGVAELVER